MSRVRRLRTSIINRERHNKVRIEKLEQGKPDAVTTVMLEDGSSIAVEIYGAGLTLLLPVNPKAIEGAMAEQIRLYGSDPALGQSLIGGLSDLVRVVAFDYEGHLRKNPRPRSLTPAGVVHDLLAIADAVGAEGFVYYGYSWLAMIGLQLAVRSVRLKGLIMGGFPPIDGPYAAMLAVTTAAYRMAGGDPAFKPTTDDLWSAEQLSRDETEQYMTLYGALQSFDDEAVQNQIICPRLCFVGSADVIQYGENWGRVLVNLAEPVIVRREALAAWGWSVTVLEGLDHVQAMQAKQVVPLIREWLTAETGLAEVKRF